LTPDNRRHFFVKCPIGVGYLEGGGTLGAIHFGWWFARLNELQLGQGWWHDNCNANPYSTLVDFFQVAFLAVDRLRAIGRVGGLDRSGAFGAGAIEELARVALIDAPLMPTFRAVVRMG